MFIIPVETIVVVLTGYTPLLADISQEGIRTLWQHIGKKKEDEKRREDGK